MMLGWNIGIGMSNRYCGKCGVQTATDEMEFEIGTAMGVSQEARIEELNSLSECYKCRSIRIHEEVRQEMDEEQGIYTCREGFFEGEDCPICEHEDGQHDSDVVGEDWEGPEFPCPYCEHPNFTNKEARVWLDNEIGILK